MRRARLSAALGCAAAIAACSGGGGGGTGPGYTVTVQPSAAALCIGDNQAYTAQVLDGSGHPVSGAVPAWSSGTPQVASIDPTSGVAHALALGTTAIVATYGGARSAAAMLDVPADLVPQFVPDSSVLAPGDTMTLGVRLRRASSGPVPAGHVPVIAPGNGTVASIDAGGLVTAKAAGRQSLSVSACGQQGSGAVDVFSPPDSATGSAYLWVSGAAELRIRLATRALNFPRTGGGPAFQIVGPSGSATRFFLYEDTVHLAAAGQYPLDSLRTTEVTTTLACSPPRPFAMYTDQNPATLTLLFGLQGGTLAVTSYASRSGYAVVSGRTVTRMRGAVPGSSRVDTLQAIYTFSAPLTDTTNVCP
jgi:hypothetical protein